MNKLYTIKVKEFIKFLEHNGCYKKRQKGSHVIYRKEGLVRPIVFQSKGDIPIHVVKSNLKTLGLKVEDLLKFLNKK